MKTSIEKFWKSLANRWVSFKFYGEFFIISFLLLMLYGLFLSIPLMDLKGPFNNRKYLLTNVLINFTWTPLFAWLLGAVFLTDYPALWIGFLMLMVIPCTDWYLMFSSLAKGNLLLSTSVLPVNVLLQVLLLPVYLFIFAGTIERVPLSVVGENILLALVIPFVLPHVTRCVICLLYTSPSPRD